MNGISALLLVGWGLPAASQVFNLRHDLNGPNSTASTAWCVELSDAGDLIVIGNSDWADSLYYSSVVATVTISPQGEVLSSAYVWNPPHATYPGWSNSSAPRADGGFVLGGGDFRTDSLGNWIQRAVLFFFDGNGLFEQMIQVGPEDQEWIGRQAKQTPDGGYVICGETSSVGNALQAFVIKTDAQGNEEWTRTYGGAWNDYAMSIDQQWGSNYFTGGQQFVGSNKQLWVQCLNDTGGVVWNKVWGSAFGEPNAHLTLASDGHPLVASGWGYATNDQSRKYLAKLDPNDGSTMWEREYGGICACPLFVVKEVTPGGDLIAAGQNVFAANYFGTLLRTTSTGDSLWMRHYQYHDSLVSNGRGILRDVVPTPDGGFVAVGSALSVPGVYTQDVWVIKVDEYGCLEPGCHLITGMETQITNLGGALRVWPNPVARGTPVQVEVQLPEGFAVQGALRLTVTDAAGRLLREEYFTTHTSALTLHTSLPSGLYHLHLHDNTRWIAGAKLVVE